MTAAHVLLPLAVLLLGFWIGRNHAIAQLVGAARRAVTDVDEDGRWGTRWSSGRQESGEAAFTVPQSLNRHASRGMARTILERQGEEGAKVAQEVLDVYRRRQDDKPQGGT